MQILINGEERDVSSDSLSNLILELGLEKKKLAIELNKQIVSRDSYDATPVQEGDQIEIVHFIGGG